MTRGRCLTVASNVAWSFSRVACFSHGNVAICKLGNKATKPLARPDESGVASSCNMHVGCYPRQHVCCLPVAYGAA